MKSSQWAPLPPDEFSIFNGTFHPKSGGTSQQPLSTHQQAFLQKSFQNLENDSRMFKNLENGSRNFQESFKNLENHSKKFEDDSRMLQVS